MADRDRAVRVWAEAVERLRAAVPGATWRLWIEPGQPTGIEDNRLVVEFPEGIFAWVARRYRALLGEAVRAVDPGGLDGVRVKKQPPPRAVKGGNDG